MQVEQPARLWTREETARFLGILPQTLALWKSAGRYSLPCIKVGRSVRYDPKDVEQFCASRKVAPDSSKGPRDH